jgi:hypothetical protein
LKTVAHDVLQIQLLMMIATAAHSEGYGGALRHVRCRMLAIWLVSPISNAFLQAAKFVASAAKWASAVLFVYSGGHEHVHIYCFIPSLLEGACLEGAFLFRTTLLFVISVFQT